MCLYTDGKPEIRKAKIPFYVYKLLHLWGKEYATPFRRAVYSENNIYTSQIGTFKPILGGELYLISKGLYSYATLGEAEKMKKLLNKECGLTCKIVKMYIPEGAYYIVGRNAQIISDILIY